MYAEICNEYLHIIYVGSVSVTASVSRYMARCWAGLGWAGTPRHRKLYITDYVNGVTEVKSIRPSSLDKQLLCQP